MKRFLCGIFLVSLLIPSFSHAEIIRRFDSSVLIQKDAVLDVKESIVYDFEGEMRHGIYRDIPYVRYGKIFSEKIALEVKSVVDDEGNQYQYSVTTEGDYKRIKIGDPNNLISGIHTYIINYSVKGAILYHDDFDELYWNVTGDAWQFPIASSSFTVVLPKAIPFSDYRILCFYGTYGSQRECKLSGQGPLPDELIHTNSYEFTSKINPGEGYTEVIGFPKGLVDESTKLEKIFKIIKDNLLLIFSGLLPFFTIITCFYIWYKFGKDPEGLNTIIPEYDVPNNLIPLEIALILNQKIESRDMSAEIIHLATLGYIRIERIEKKEFIGKKIDYELVQLDKDKSGLHEADDNLLSVLFKFGPSIKLSSLKNTFYMDYKDICEKTNNILVQKGMYEISPEKISKKYTNIFGVICFAIFAGFLIILNIKVNVDYTGLFALAVSMFISGLVIYIFGFFMPKKTVAGVNTKSHLLGLKKYISVAEKDRIDFHNAPEKNPQLFEKLLPVAMIMNLENKWANEFKDIYITNPPEWYRGNMMVFSTLDLTNDLSGGFESAMSGAFTAPGGSGGSGFGGGGFSGGGFGGGGGGSW